MPAIHAAALAVAWTALSGGLLSACNPSNECSAGESSCDGDVAQSCEPKETGDGLFYVWNRTTCAANSCKRDEQAGAFCSLTPDPEPRCAGTRSGFCDGTTVVTCLAGYATARNDCASPSALRPGTPFCAELPPDPQMAAQISSALCVAESNPSPACPVDESDALACDGNDSLDCVDGNILTRTSCGTLFCVAKAGCALSPDPDPGCPPGEPDQSYCEGNAVVQCRYGFRLSKTACVPSATCSVTPNACSNLGDQQCTLASCH